MGYRAFVVATHAAHGVLLLRGREKKKKGKPSHWQLPGGRVDPGEAPVQAAAREFREETGIVVDESRLKQVLDPRDFDGRFYFELELTDADTLRESDAGTARGSASGDFQLRLSPEHTGFTFEKDLRVCARMVELHSKGFNSRALQALAFLAEQGDGVAVAM